jgi:hypothetical protein
MILVAPLIPAYVQPKSRSVKPGSFKRRMTKKQIELEEAKEEET